MAGDASGPGSDRGDDEVRADDRDGWRFGNADGRDRPPESRSTEPDRFPLDRADRSRDDGLDDDEESDRRGPEPNSTPVEPGQPSLENAVFVLFGAVLMVLVILRLVSLLPVG